MIPRRSPAFIVLFSTALLGASCAPNPQPTPPTPQARPIERTARDDDAEQSIAPLLASYRAGVAEALREIRADQLTLSTAGIIRSTTRDASGMQVNTVETDAVDAATLMRIMGHNDTVRMWKNLPTNPTP